MKIALLTGGTSVERNVSIASANNVVSVLNFGECQVFILPADLELFLKLYKNFDIAVPMIHGRGGEDGSIQGLLESLGLPYIFSGIQAHAIGIDKVRTKSLAKTLRVRVVETIDVSKPQFPLFAKPRYGGSSVSSGLCNTKEDLDTLLKSNPEEFVLEVPLKGREFTVGVVEYNGRIESLPVIEIVTSGSPFFDYESKYNSEKLASEICPAQIPEELAKRLQKSALIVHKELGVRHISRSDFIVQGSQEYFLEINTIPGMTKTSLIPKMLLHAKLDIKTLFKSWCEEVHRAKG